MITELEMPAPSSANHRHLEEMMMYSSILTNAAHAYMNSSCQTLSQSNEGDELLLNHEYRPLFQGRNLDNIAHFQNAVAVRAQDLELEGVSPSAFGQETSVAVDNVPPYNITPASCDYITGTSCNNLMAFHEPDTYLMMAHQEFPGVGYTADYVSDQLFYWASTPCLDLYNADPPPVNTYLGDDIMLSDKSAISSMLSSNEPFDDSSQHFSPLNLHIPMKADTISGCNLGSVNHSSPEIVVQSALDLGMEAALASTELHAMLDEEGFADGQFVSALFSDDDVPAHNVQRRSQKTKTFAEADAAMQIRAGKLSAFDGADDQSSMQSSAAMKDAARRPVNRSINANAHPQQQLGSRVFESCPGSKRSAQEVADDGDGPARKKPGASSPAGAAARQDAEGGVTARAAGAASPASNSEVKMSSVGAALPPSQSPRAATPQASNSATAGHGSLDGKCRTSSTARAASRSAARAAKQPSACDPQSVAARPLKLHKGLSGNESQIDDLQGLSQPALKDAQQCIFNPWGAPEIADRSFRC